MAHAASPPDTYPEPVEHCGICEWQQSCAERRRADDHLSLVAGITRGQRGRLVERDVTTMAALRALRLPVSPRVDGIAEAALARIHEQARVQDQARREGRRIHELITPGESDKGLAALPEPSDGDLFFDLEGDAFAADGGLEYLFGVVERDGTYNASWALDPVTEKRAFERFIDNFMARWEQQPGFHIYHYGAYETTAVKRLMSRYATREDEVDRLLRGRVFVDLHRVVRQALRASVESYSLKRLEPFYGFARTVDLTAATRALIQVEVRLESGDAAGVPEPLRTEIEGYNRDDCLSTLRLAAWLEECRRDLQALTGQLVPRPKRRDEERDREQEPAVETAALFEALTAGLPVDDAELDESRATLGALTYGGEAGQVKRSVIHRYRFLEQPHEIEVGDSPKNPDTAESDEFKRGFCGTVVALDETTGTVDLKRGRSSSVPHPAALVPLDNIQNKVLRESLARLAEAVVSGGFAADSLRRAAFDLLGLVPPRIGAPASPPNTSGFAAREDLVAPGEAPLPAVRRIAPRLDRSVLPVQGPPGSGKTYTGARMILDLLAGGKRVGVTANSHKVISNLLAAVCAAADEPPGENGRTGGASDGGPAGQAPVEMHGIQKANDADGCPDERIVQAGSNAEVAEALATGEANLAGGTAWLWAREEMADAVDVLVIDEAGQMSLANTLAVCQAAGSLVLLGDPRQLDQPIQGVPPGADVSALGHLLGKSATVAPSRGVFLDQTWRMHPDICAFTTEQFYEGRLRSEPGLRRQTVVGTGPLAGHGLRFIPVAHAGNTNASAEEAECVAGLIRELLGTDAAWVDRQRVQRRLTLDDVLVVAPYNAHLAVLRATLPTGARVGTVDKFQGQEAPIVIYSMATSSADEAPRGMEFLYSLHRLNVATSRARCVAAIVASPTLLTPDCRTRSRCAWPTPSAASSNSPRPHPDTRAEVNISPVIRLEAGATPNGTDDPHGGHLRHVFQLS